MIDDRFDTTSCIVTPGVFFVMGRGVCDRYTLEHLSTQIASARRCTFTESTS